MNERNIYLYYIYIQSKYFLKILFIHERQREKERERGRDTGRGRSRLHAGSLTRDPIPKDIFLKSILRKESELQWTYTYFVFSIFKSFRCKGKTSRIWTPSGVFMLFMCPWDYKTVDVH